MNDEAIIDALRTKAKHLPPVQIAELLDEMTGGGLSQRTMVMYFKRAFKNIPLGTLRDAEAWNRISGGGLKDTDFNQLLSPWLATESKPMPDHTAKPNTS